MAADHLVGSNREEGELVVDPGAFLLTAAIAVGLGLVLFGRVVPSLQDPARAASVGLGFALTAVLTLPLIFLAFPIVLAGAGVALGLRARNEAKRRTASAAIALGALVLLLGVVYTIASVLG